MKVMNRQTLLAAILAGSAISLAMPGVAQDQAGNGAQAQTQQQPKLPGNGKGPMGGPMGGPDDRAGFGFDITVFDANGDGKVTLEEIQAKRAADAKALDANGDGVISEEELVDFELAKAKTRIEARVKARFAAQDSNGDGVLSAAELMERPLPTRMFQRLDRDGDGAVSAEEMQAARKMMQRRMGDRDGRGGHSRMGDRDHHGKMMRDGHGRMGDGPMGPGNGPRWQDDDAN